MGAYDSTCMYSSKPHTNVQVSTYTKVTPDSVTALQDAVAMQPVSVSICAEKAYFQTYQSGVLTSTACGTIIDHAVLAVGYGQESGTDYFLVKNSWAPPGVRMATSRLPPSTASASAASSPALFTPP